MSNQLSQQTQELVENFRQDTQNKSEVPINSHRRLSRWKKNASIGLVLLLIASGGYGYYQFTQLQQWYSDAQSAIENQQQANYAISDYVFLRMQIEEKEKYCQEFLASEAGEFGEFEFCKRYIEWSKEVKFEQKQR